MNTDNFSKSEFALILNGKITKELPYREDDFFKTIPGDAFQLFFYRNMVQKKVFFTMAIYNWAEGGIIFINSGSHTNVEVDDDIFDFLKEQFCDHTLDCIEKEIKLLDVRREFRDTQIDVISNAIFECVEDMKKQEEMQTTALLKWRNR